MRGILALNLLTPDKYKSRLGDIVLPHLRAAIFLISLFIMYQSALVHAKGSCGKGGALGESTGAAGPNTYIKSAFPLVTIHQNQCPCCLLFMATREIRG